MVCSRSQVNVDKSLLELKEGANRKDDVQGIAAHIGKDTDRELLIEETLKRFGSIDCLVSTVGVHIHHGSIVTCDLGAWRKLFEGNVTSTLFLAKDVLPVMKDRGKGSIVFTATIEAFSSARVRFVR